MAEIAFYNKEVVYGILFRAASETLLTIAADPKHLGGGIGFFGILLTQRRRPMVHLSNRSGEILLAARRWRAGGLNDPTPNHRT